MRAERIATLYFNDRTSIEVFYRPDGFGMEYDDPTGAFLNILDSALGCRRSTFFLLWSPFVAKMGGGGFVDCLILDGLRGFKTEERYRAGSITAKRPVST